MVMGSMTPKLKTWHLDKDPKEYAPFGKETLWPFEIGIDVLPPPWTLVIDLLLDPSINPVDLQSSICLNQVRKSS